MKRELTGGEKKRFVAEMAPAIRSIMKAAGSDVELKALINALESGKSKLVLDLPEDFKPGIGKTAGVQEVETLTQERTTTSGRLPAGLQPLEVHIRAGKERS